MWKIEARFSWHVGLTILFIIYRILQFPRIPLEKLNLFHSSISRIFAYHGKHFHTIELDFPTFQRCPHSDPHKLNTQPTPPLIVTQSPLSRHSIRFPQIIYFLTEVFPSTLYATLLNCFCESWSCVDSLQACVRSCLAQKISQICNCSEPRFPINNTSCLSEKEGKVKTCKHVCAHSHIDAPKTNSKTSTCADTCI